MDDNKEIEKLQRRIERIKKHLSELGEMRPGSLSTQYNVCGNPTCRCKRPDNPIRHRPYYQISYTRGGKSKTEFVKSEDVEKVRLQLRNYHTFKELTDEWVDVSLAIAHLRKKE
ncbi:MAG TPA: hypothetical protein DCP92_06835 [Nitrospiraceae bacterium]|jgi:hypothetical protein|nr:hypothetical protein [Nitrospiraceae bacterium]